MRVELYKLLLKCILLVVLLIVSSCTGIRNVGTYSMELVYLEMSLTRQGELVKEYIKTNCCSGSSYQESIDCHAAVDTYLTVKQRSKYHLDMMRYLGRLSDDRPELPQIVVEGALVCE